MSESVRSVVSSMGRAGLLLAALMAAASHASAQDESPTGAAPAPALSATREDFLADVQRMLDESAMFRGAAFQRSDDFAPAAIFVQELPASRPEAAAALVAEFGASVRALEQRFREEFVVPLQLRPMQDGGACALIVLRSRSIYDSYLLDADDNDRFRDLARYDPELRAVVTFRDWASPVDAAEQRHAVLHGLARALVRSHADESEHPAALWLTEGLAGYLSAATEVSAPTAASGAPAGGAAPAGSAAAGPTASSAASAAAAAPSATEPAPPIDARTLQSYLARAANPKRGRHVGTMLPPVAQLVALATDADLAKCARQFSLPKDKMRAQVSAASALFVTWLATSKDPALRGPFLTYVRSALGGDASAAALERAFPPETYGKLERAFDTFVVAERDRHAASAPASSPSPEDASDDESTAAASAPETAGPSATPGAAKATGAASAPKASGAVAAGEAAKTPGAAAPTGAAGEPVAAAPASAGKGAAATAPVSAGKGATAAAPKSAAEGASSAAPAGAARGSAAAEPTSAGKGATASAPAGAAEGSTAAAPTSAGKGAAAAAPASGTKASGGAGASGATKSSAVSPSSDGSKDAETAKNAKVAKRSGSAKDSGSHESADAAEAATAAARAELLAELTRVLKEAPQFSAAPMVLAGDFAPAIVFVQQPPDADATYPAAVADADGPWVAALAQRFREEFAGPLDLPARRDGDACALVVLASHTLYGDYLQRGEHVGPYDHWAYYDPELRAVVTYDDRADPANASEHRHAMLHEMVHALERSHSATRELPAALWLCEGLAGYLSAATSPTAGAEALGQLDQRALEGFAASNRKAPRERAAKLAAPAELVALTGNTELARRAKAASLSGTDLLRPLMEESSLFVHFLLATGDETLRAAFLRYVRGAMEGDASAETFEKSFAPDVYASLRERFQDYLREAGTHLVTNSLKSFEFTDAPAPGSGDESEEAASDEDQRGAQK